MELHSLAGLPGNSGRAPQPSSSMSEPGESTRGRQSLGEEQGAVRGSSPSTDFQWAEPLTCTQRRAPLLGKQDVCKNLSSSRSSVGSGGPHSTTGQGLKGPTLVPHRSGAWEYAVRVPAGVGFWRDSFPALGSCRLAKSSGGVWAALAAGLIRVPEPSVPSAHPSWRLQGGPRRFPTLLGRGRSSISSLLSPL